MQRAEGLPAPGAFAGPSVVTIGVFDGLHRGHTALLSRVCELANTRRAQSVVLTFREHPDALLRGRAPARLLSLEDRLDGLQGFGIDAAFVLDFDRRLMSMRAEEFASTILREGLGCEALVLGHDSAICKNREGTAERFRELGLHAERIARFSLDGKVVSASAIRDALGSGDLETANQMLGRHYVLHGQVEHGAGRGKTIGIPTANLHVPDVCLPADGVYAVWASGPSLRARYRGVTNLGHRPTFGDGSHSIETHILGAPDPDALDLYGRELCLEFVTRLRDERSFEDAQALRQQIDRDIEQARVHLNL